MTKKSFLLAIVLIVALSCVYAQSFNAEIKASPYSLQYIKGDNASFLSKYGFGFETGLRFNFNEVFSMGLNIKYSNYKYDESADNYHVLYVLMPYIGCTQTINDKWTLTTDLGVGIHERMLGDMKESFVGVNLYLGAGYAISEKVSLTAGADFGLCYQSNSCDFSADAMLGARFVL